MNRVNEYSPGAADVARVEKHGEEWTLVVNRELRHPPERVWRALTDPEHLREWAPFDVDGSLAIAGAKVQLSTVGTPYASETVVTRAEPPNALEYKWGDFNMRWKLEASGQGTRLTLWTNIDRRYIAMGAAGWQICLDVLDRLLDGAPIGRMVGQETMKFEGFQRLHKEYAKQFGVANRAGNDLGGDEDRS
jgi:uncharacterized protein YndB with AHSA1/START domain